MKQEIQNHLPGTHPWQNTLFYYPELPSTNTLAKEMALQGAAHGTVLIADKQTGGRGRMGRSFHSPDGMGVYMSVILRYPKTPAALMHLTCAVATVLCDAVEQAVSLRPGIKWTNDLVHGGRKLAGVLTELVSLGDETAAIVGIGINCAQTLEDFPPELADFAGSLAMATGKPVDRARLISCILRSLYDMDVHLFSCKELLLENYKDDCITLGKEISLVQGETVSHALALDITQDGALVIGLSNGEEKTVTSGEVSIRGMYGYV